MSNIAIIPARMGSKGIPNKNITNLCGRPLVEYSIEVAVESNNIDYVIVTSDSEDVLAIAKNFGDKVIPQRRPVELCMDDSSADSVVIHATNILSNSGIFLDNIVLLQPTSPHRKVEFIQESITLIEKSKKGSLISVSDPIQHPYDFLCEHENTIEYLSRDKGVSRRQDFKAVKFINGSIYITKHDFLLKTGKIYALDNCVLYDMPINFSIDIDTRFDLMMCEAIMSHEKGKNIL
jgi:CMP-N,N'-diacetyllegionaminic acid synthase